MSIITSDLQRAIKQAVTLGVPWENIIIDPGIGFGKTQEQNLKILRRLEGTAATLAIGIAKGVDIVRVHDVKEMVRVCKMSDAIIRGG